MKMLWTFFVHLVVACLVYVAAKLHFDPSIDLTAAGTALAGLIAGVFGMAAHHYFPWLMKRKDGGGIAAVAVIAGLVMAFGLAGCNAPTTADPVVMVGEDLALRAAQGQLNRLRDEKKMTDAQYVEASNILKSASDKLATSNGVLTQADANQLITDAIRAAFKLYIPTLPPVGPTTQP